MQVSAGIHVKGRVDLAVTPTGAQFSSVRTYADSKLANLLLLPLWARRWAGAGIAVNAVHPGVVRTDLGDRDGALGVLLRLAKRRWMSPAEGAEPVLRLATSPALEGVSGRYFEVDVTTPAEPAERARDLRLAQDVWEHAAGATGVPVTVGR